MSFTTAKATGSIIIVAAVFEIHIDKKAVAIINPNIIFFRLLPTLFSIITAILLCKFHFSIAIDKMNPPMNKKING